LQSALDDLAGARRRVERDAERAREEAQADVVKGLLPVLDSLDRSIAAAGSSSDEALFRGVLMVRDQFEQAMARCGLERIDAVGKPFDPKEHEALAVVDVDRPELWGTVIDELERGYRLGGKLLRAPKVRVARHP
jgi:molecular chaperone GrpE